MVVLEAHEILGKAGLAAKVLCFANTAPFQVLRTAVFRLPECSSCHSVVVA